MTNRAASILVIAILLVSRPGRADECLPGATNFVSPGALVSFLSVGVVMVALRGTFEGSGDPNAPSTTLDFGFKYPLAVTAHHVAYANSDCFWGDHH